jgi:septation ring formation regulator EzrA
MTEAKQHLESYNILRKKLDRITEEIDTVRTRWTSTSMAMDGMPHSHGGHDLSEYAAQIDELTREHDDIHSKLKELRKDIIDRLDRMESTTDVETERDVLYYRYICGLPWEEIASKTHHEYRYTLKIHGRALQHYPTDGLAA